MGETASLGPTAIMPAVGLHCPACSKENHVGVSQCVFCGADMPRDSGESPPRESGDSNARETDRIEPTSARSAWAEGPESGNSDDSPPSRRGSQLPSFEEIPTGAVADPLIGVVVADRYRILEPLGRGGMGIVYKVEHTRIGKLLAMKLLTGELSRNPDVVRRFKQEALTASKLSSPNTVQVFDFGASEGLTYLVMELVAGEDLSRTLRMHGPMSASRLGKIIVQVCSSLAEAHAKGIVHRDIKPENIMLLKARDGTDLAKVLDFGLAKLRESSELNEVTSQGAIVGTPYFMAPEQVRGESVDNRTDIYALGALMYRAITGHYPFTGPTPMAVFTRHLTEPVIPPIERAPELHIPQALSDIVLRMLGKNPSERYQKVEDVQLAVLEELRAGGTSSVETLLDSGQLRKLSKVSVEVNAPSIHGFAPIKVEIATRDEVEAYERKLRRQKYGVYVGLAAVLVAFGGVATKLALTESKVEFTGHEREPNDSAKQANELPLGKEIRGSLGKRIDAAHSDRDFYAFNVTGQPGRPTVVQLDVSALPNFAMCTLVYRQGLETPLGQYCVGRTARDLSIPALALEPGKHFLAVMQDLDPYGRTAPPVFENISDEYTVRVDVAADAVGLEIEPNDQIGSANDLGPGRALRGALRWARDEDVYCVAKDALVPVKWKVRDVARDGGSVLEVTPLKGAEEGAPVRVHVSADVGGRAPQTPGKGSVSASDVMSPWTSARLPPGEVTRCVRVRLANDPWVNAGSTVVPSGSIEAYTVEVEAAP